MPTLLPPPRPSISSKITSNTGALSTADMRWLDVLPVLIEVERGRGKSLANLSKDGLDDVTKRNEEIKKLNGLMDTVNASIASAEKSGVSATWIAQNSSTKPTLDATNKLYEALRAAGCEMADCDKVDGLWRSTTAVKKTWIAALKGRMEDLTSVQTLETKRLESTTSKTSEITQETSKWIGEHHQAIMAALQGG